MLLDFINSVGDVVATTSSTFLGILDNFETEGSTWGAFLVSPVFGIWASPIVGVLAVVAAMLNLRKMQRQIDLVKRESQVRDLIESAWRKELKLQKFLDELLPPDGDLAVAMAIYFSKRGRWQQGFDVKFKTDMEKKLITVLPKESSGDETEGDVWEFQSHVAFLMMLLDADKEKVRSCYLEDEDDFFGIRERVVSFSAYWLHLLYLVNEAVKLGFSKKVAGLMLREWQHAAELHHAVGAIPDSHFDLAKNIIEEGGPL